MVESLIKKSTNKKQIQEPDPLGTKTITMVIDQVSIHLRIFIQVGTFPQPIGLGSRFSRRVMSFLVVRMAGWEVDPKYETFTSQHLVDFMLGECR